MSYVLRAAAAYVVLVGVAVAVHFVITPFYHAGDAPFTAWHYMNWFIAAALLVTLGASYAGKRRMESDGAAEIKRYLEANLVFYGTVAASIIFFWSWFLELVPGADSGQRVRPSILARVGRGAAHLDGGCRPAVLEHAQRARRYRLTGSAVQPSPGHLEPVMKPVAPSLVAAGAVVSWTVATGDVYLG